MPKHVDRNHFVPVHASHTAEVEVGTPNGRAMGVDSRTSQPGELTQPVPGGEGVLRAGREGRGAGLKGLVSLCGGDLDPPPPIIEHFGHFYYGDLDGFRPLHPLKSLHLSL